MLQSNSSRRTPIQTKNSKPIQTKNSKPIQTKNSKPIQTKNSVRLNNRKKTKKINRKYQSKKNEIKISKIELNKIVKALFSNMDVDDNKTIKIIRSLGQNDDSVTKLTKFIKKTKTEDLKVSTDIITNMGSIKDTILSLYKQFEKLNKDLSILLGRKKLQ